MALSVVSLLYVYTRSTQIQWGKWLIFYHMSHWTLNFPYTESVVILPSLGVQFETHKGFAGISLLAARKFVPWASLEDFLINEGLYGWNVRYYSVAINRTPQGSLQLEVAFEVGVLPLAIQSGTLLTAPTELTPTIPGPTRGIPRRTRGSPG